MFQILHDNADNIKPFPVKRKKTTGNKQTACESQKNVLENQDSGSGSYGNSVTSFLASPNQLWPESPRKFIHPSTCSQGNRNISKVKSWE